jgi:hypothetical protein
LQGNLSDDAQGRRTTSAPDCRFVQTPVVKRTALRRDRLAQVGDVDVPDLG